MITFPDFASLSGMPRFSAEIVLQGSWPDPATKGEAGNIWIEVEGRADCLRFFGQQFANDTPPLIYLEGDCSRRVGDRWATFDGYTDQSPGKLQLWAEQVARRDPAHLREPGTARCLWFLRRSPASASSTGSRAGGRRPDGFEGGVRLAGHRPSPAYRAAAISWLP